MLKTFPRLPVASAIVLMLAACGGSGGDSADTTINAARGTAPSLSTTADLTTDSTESATTADTGTATGSTVGNDTASQGTSNPNDASAQHTVHHPLAAISQQGIRGDVLLTGLSQLSCNAFLEQSTAIDGVRVTGEQANALPTVGAGTTLEPTNYVRRADAPAYVSPMASICDTHQYQAPANGVYELEVFSNPLYRYSFGATRGFHYLDAEFQLTVSDSSFSLASVAELSNTADRVEGNPKQELHAYSQGDFVVQNTQLVAFNTEHRWAAGQHQIKLLVLPVPREDMFKLCWNAHLEFAKRLQCTVWQVPGDWSLGQPLVYVDQYLTDDRSTYAGEAHGDFVHFRNRF